MRLTSLPIGLVLLVATASPSSASLVPRAIHKIHGAAVRHTKSLARDLRVAFGGVLVAQPNTQSTHAVYCKQGKSGTFPVGGNIGGSGNNTDSVSSSRASGSSSRAPGSTTRTSSGTKTSTGAKPTDTASASSPWKLTQSHEGNSFYDGWDFFTGSDPTHGIVQFLDQNAARANGLLDVNGAGNAIMRVETTPNVANTRKSVRITTQSSFNGGLITMDAVHMPTGCGVWPAFWTNGPNWPSGGEIDIVEGVHDYTHNQATIHTDGGCRLSTNNLQISGTVIGGTNCAALTTGNQGCGIRAPTSNSFGAGFNANGGGTYAMQWDSSGIAVYFFPRGSQPADITAEVPRPETWGAAQARWPADGCDPFKFFNNHHAIFDTTLCGDWAGGVWNSAGIPGQEESCAQRTGFSTCDAFVRANGASMSEAYWEVKSVKIYQFKG
ncbi:putative glycosidase C21B10.07 [Hypsizygus marmoreus]|uniref:Glycosidase C21B10.07 n=1 Tax=Hypsizygus marmoreus TaxID=39966 RepID=A0A369K672_HYPMA|nr:putative glycosidase C21B10.07 [Hypsizygus marmoreus]